MLYLVGWTWIGEEIKDLHFPLPHKQLIIQMSVEVGQTKWIAGIGFFFFTNLICKIQISQYLSQYLYIKLRKEIKTLKRDPPECLP